jgi:hypothetical protein
MEACGTVGVTMGGVGRGSTDTVGVAISLSSIPVPNCNFAPSAILGKAAGLKLILSGRNLFVALARPVPKAGDAISSCTPASTSFKSASEFGLEGIVVVVLYPDVCDVTDTSDDGRELSDGSDHVRAENDMLGGRDDDAPDDRRLDAGLSVATCFGLALGNGRKNDTLVRARLNTGLSSRSSDAGAGALTSGSLYSSFPCLSDAKYSSPRPKTT